MKTEGTLNPVHLAIAERGYWIQSRILRIPDRFGYFSPGPLQLQAYQSAFLAYEIIMLVRLILGNCAGITLGQWLVGPVSFSYWPSFALSISMVILDFIFEFKHDRRKPGYNWGGGELLEGKCHEIAGATNQIRPKSTVITTIRQFFGLSRIDNRPNSTHIPVASRG